MMFRISRHAAILSTLSLGIGVLAGCGNGFVSTPVTAAAVVVTGNWQFTSASATATQLSSFSGELTGTNTSFTGILHSNSALACVSPKASFAVAGSADAKGNLTLTGSNVGGGKLVLTGILAADGKSISNSVYTVTGGSCAFAKEAVATSQAFADISGDYSGSFVDSDNDAFPVAATLTQSPSSDTNGDFSLSGSATFPHNPCFGDSAQVSKASVTGGTFDVTYGDASNGGSALEVSGTFSADAKSLTIKAWNAVGPCGSLSGTGTLTKQ